MKRLLYILSLLPIGLNAQNMYNVASFLENELTGTARYVGMGGSMSALGADLTTMTTNPAGIAMFRSNDFSFTAGLDIKNNEANYFGTVLKSGKTNAYVGNSSIVISLNRDGEKLKYLNFGLGYRLKNNLSGVFEMAGASNGWSQQDVIDALYKDYEFDYTKVNGQMYEQFVRSWLPMLAAGAEMYDEYGNFISTPDSSLIWSPDEHAFYEETRGGVYSVDFNVSANISDRIYLGMTIGASVVDYNRYSEYREIDEYGDIYVLENNKYLKGSGFDIKLGAIFRPFKYLPFKVGVSVHTPTWYSLNEYSSAAMTGPYGMHVATTDHDIYRDVLSVSSNFNTPWRVNASMAYTVGTFLALNAEYEFADYTQTEFTDRGQVYKGQNEEIKCNLKAQHIVRVGAELNVKGYALRAGYNYISAPFNKDAYKYLYNSALYNGTVAETSTDYMNHFGKNIVTLGCGYRSQMFYCDIAYKLEMQQSEFYPFSDFEYLNPGASVNSTKHSLIATVGMRF